MDKRRSDVLKASPRMFESNLLDKLSRVHPVVPLIIFIPAIAVLFALGQEGTPPLEVSAWIAGGWIF
jgi:dihydroceramide fatty acyl 2-hydroxylase